MGDGESIELRKLTKREDRLRAQGIWPSLAGGDIETKKKMLNFIRLLNKERRNLGIPEDPTLKELGNEK